MHAMRHATTASKSSGEKTKGRVDPAASQRRIVKLVTAARIDTAALAAFNEGWGEWSLKEGSTSPFHMLCANKGVTAAAIESAAEGLRQARAAEMTDQRGRRGIHVLCANPAASSATVEAVAALDPSSLLSQTRFGAATPLHEACAAAVMKPAVLTALCKLEPRALGAKDSRTRTPLHVLCAARCKDGLTDHRLGAVVPFVSEATALELDADGAAPLHLLCANPNATADGVVLVGSLAPAAARIWAPSSIHRDDDDGHHGRVAGEDDHSSSRRHGGALRDGESKEESYEETDEGVKISSSGVGLDGSATSSSRRRRRSKILDALPSGLGFKLGTMSNKLGGMFTSLRSILDDDDDRLLPLHIACGARYHRISPDLLRAVAKLYPGAAASASKTHRRLPLHLLASNDASATPGNMAAVFELHRGAIDALDAHNATPVDLMARFVIERYGWFVLSLCPKKALYVPGQCQHCLLHYACLIDHDTTERVVTSMYEQLSEHPPLAVYMTLPEISREALASTTLVVNLVDKIFTAPSVVAFLFWETLTCVVMVLAFFKFCHNAIEQPNSQLASSSVLAASLGLSAIHILHIVLTKLLYVIKLSRHNKIRYFLTAWNFVDLATVVMWTATVCTFSVGRARDFRVVAACAQLVVPTRLLKLAKGLNQNIGAFVLCLMNVFRALLPFGFVLGLVIISFASSFETLLGHKTNHDMGVITRNGEVIPDDNEYSSFPKALFAVIRLGLVGDIEADVFEDTAAAVALLVLFIFLVAIVLLNVLIAVVSDAYEATLTNSEAIYLRSRLESAAEMQSMFPASMFDHANTGLLLIVSVALFPGTIVWVSMVALARFFKGAGSAHQMHPKRLLAFARPPDEEEDASAQRAKQASREQVLEQNLIKAISKLQADLEERLRGLDESYGDRLGKLETVVASLAADKSVQNALSDQNRHIDTVFARLHDDVQTVPAQVAARIDTIDRAVAELDRDDRGPFDRIIDPCISASSASDY